MARRRPEPVALSADLIARCHEGMPCDDALHTPEWSEEEIRASLRAFVAQSAHRDHLWIFAYGSLLWHPELDVAEARTGRIGGYHRRFCLWQWRYRGSRERPGLMLALDRGGACRGVAYRVRGPRLEDEVYDVWRREMRGDGYRPRWVSVATSSGSVPAVAFVANRAGRRYAGRLSERRVCEHLAAARGVKGAAAEYLRRLVLTLEGLGIRDAALWRLQRRVAALLDRSASRTSASGRSRTG